MIKNEVATKADLEKLKANLIKGMFFFWISQVVALIGILSVAKIF